MARPPDRTIDDVLVDELLRASFARRGCRCARIDVVPVRIDGVLHVEIRHDPGCAALRGAP